MINIDPYTFILGALNLVILFLVLRKVLFKRVTSFIANRTNSIKTAIENAEENKVAAEEIKKKYEELLLGARIEATKIVDESKSKAYREYEEIVNTAKQDSAKILVKAREEIEYEKDQMLKDVRNQVATLALAAASKVIEANMDTESNKALVKKFIDGVGAA